MRLNGGHRDDLTLLQIVFDIEELIKAILIKNTIVNLGLNVITNFYVFVCFIFVEFLRFYTESFYLRNLRLCVFALIMLLFCVHVAIRFFFRYWNFLCDLLISFLFVLLFKLLWSSILKDFHLSNFRFSSTWNFNRQFFVIKEVFFNFKLSYRIILKPIFLF